MGTNMAKWKFSKDKTRVEIEDVELYRKSQENIASDSDDLRHIERNAETVNALLTNGKNINYVIDIGCREGLTEKILSDKGIHCRGVDVSKKSVEYAKSQGRDVIFGDAHELSEYCEKKADAIMMVHSLEHCYDPDKVMQECLECLRDGGYLAIRVPVQKDITVQPLLKENAEHSSDGLPAHYSVFTGKAVKELVERNGFKKLFSKFFKPDTKYEEFLIVAQKA